VSCEITASDVSQRLSTLYDKEPSDRGVLPILIVLEKGEYVQTHRWPAVYILL
jgi:hypothetical protein